MTGLVVAKTSESIIIIIIINLDIDYELKATSSLLNVLSFHDRKKNKENCTP